jgi:hypothetical protein
MIVEEREATASGPALFVVEVNYLIYLCPNEEQNI